MIFFYTCRFLFIRSMWWIPHADANLGKPWWNSRVFPMFFNDLGLPQIDPTPSFFRVKYGEIPMFRGENHGKNHHFHHFSWCEIPPTSAGAASAASGGGRSLETVSWHQHPKKTGEKWWFQHVSTMVFHGEMMVLTMVLTRKWWFHGDWQFNHEQNAGFMGISWGKWSIWWSWPWRKDGDITILAMQGWWLVISWGFKQRWYRGKLMEYLTEYYQPYGVFFIVVSWWFHRESTHFYG